MNDDEKKQILQEIIKLTGHATKRPGDMTLKDYIDVTGISNAGARERLKKCVERGDLETELVYDPAAKRQVKVWRPAKRTISKEKE